MGIQMRLKSMNTRCLYQFESHCPNTWLYGVTVSTSVSEAESPGSNPGGATTFESNVI